VTAGSKLRRLWGNEYLLQDLLDQAGKDAGFTVRDFALLTLAGQLSAQFPGQIVFKGGFVLRHVHGVQRLSTDVDATRHLPPRQKFDSDEIADAIREASVGDTIRFSPQKPTTDTGRSLDFDDVRVTGSLLEDTRVQVEISYREEVVDPPERALIGSPFYEDFEVLAMAPWEMAAEKLRALAQRYVPTDLADLAELLTRADVLDSDVARLARSKFELVGYGSANRGERIERRVADMATDYDYTVPALFPEARSYRDAKAIVWPRIKALIP
jgi:predicted nucleotidyltransferase component of viral defense system